MSRVGMTMGEFVRMAHRVMEKRPNATLVKNKVGNLAILDDDEFVGYLDLLDGEVVLTAEEESWG